MNDRLPTLRSRIVRGSLLASLLSFASMAACAFPLFGGGRVETEARDVSGFRSVAFSGSGILKVHRGEFRVLVKTNSSAQDRVITRVVGSSLQVFYRFGFFQPRPSVLEIEVTMPELEGLSVSGSGNAYVDAFSGKDFSARVSGSGGMKAALDYDSVALVGSGSGGYDLELEAKRLELRLSGSVAAFLRGKADSADIHISGSGEIGARDFAAGEAEVRMSGSGSVEIRAERSLDVAASGSGSVKYWGSPQLSTKLSGSGKVGKGGS